MAHGTLRIRIAAALAAICSLPSAPGLAHGQAVAPPAPPPAWPQDRSDVPADPAVRYGVLSNGMRYVLMHSAGYVNMTALRLRVDAGSLDETEEQRGIAHFIEHLTLNETNHVPEGEMIRILERAGLSFGADTNALTTFEQTVYRLDLPRSDAQTLDTGLMLMREVAGEATLRQSVIDGERGVVLAEERTRATPVLRMAEDELAFLFRGDPLAERMPIGLTSVITTAPRARFAAFYDAHYRPERTVLVAVGDFDLAEMERKVRARFSAWEGRGAAAPDRLPLRPRSAGETIRLFQAEGLPARVTMSWVAPRDTRPDSVAARAEEVRRAIGIAIINRRFERLAAGDNPPFIAGVAARIVVAERARLAQILAVHQPGAWRRALQTVEQEHRRAVRFGFTQAEIDREVGEMRTALAAQVRGAGTRPTASLAAAIVTAVGDRRVVTTPQTDLDLFERGVAGLTAAQVSATFRETFGPGAPLVHMATAQPIPNGETAIGAALDASREVAVAAPADEQARSWPYTDFGTPGRVVERAELADVDATAIRFANGVRVVVKPTRFRDDEVLVSVRFGHGLLGLPADRPSPVWAYLLGGFAGGGPGRIGFEDMQAVLGARTYSVEPGMEEDAFTLTGQTRTDDVATQLQVLAAYVRDPAWRASPYDRLRALSGAIMDRLESTPDGIYQRDSQALLHAGDLRWATPTREMMANTPVTALSGLIGPGLANGPLEVVIVGDITVDEAVRQTAATFGAMPVRPPLAAAAGAPVRFPAAGSVTLLLRGRADQALGFVAWPTAGGYDDQRRTRALDLLARVFQLRLLDEVRERQGTAYAPEAVHNGSAAIGGYGYFGALVQAPPAALGAFFRAASDIARSLREQPVSADEMERARRPQLEAMERSREGGNRWWLSHLGGALDHPERIVGIVGGIEETRALTPADLQQVARQYLTDAAAWRLSVLPQEQAAPAAQ